jgi:Lon protease-like protein
MSTTTIPSTHNPFHAGELEEIALFPLPEVSLFPHTIVPLHIFEPRYRQMVEDALERDMLIAIALPTSAESDPSEDGGLRVHAVAGAGRIVHHERLDDGRFHVMLRGAGRIRILDELPRERLYRRVRAVWVPSHAVASVQVHTHVASIRALVMAMVRSGNRLGALLARFTTDVEDPVILADLLCAILFASPVERQRLLEQDDVCVRYERIEGRLAEMLAGEADALAH